MSTLRMIGLPSGPRGGDGRRSGELVIIRCVQQYAVQQMFVFIVSRPTDVSIVVVTMLRSA